MTKPLYLTLRCDNCLQTIKKLFIDQKNETPEIDILQTSGVTFRCDCGHSYQSGDVVVSCLTHPREPVVQNDFLKF